MKCPACEFESPEGFRFCGGCGAGLATACPSCSTENPPGMRFCGQCGAGLSQGAAAGPAAPEPSAESPTDEGAVRRQVTVMFCDLADSTFLSENLDPEELHEILGAYQRMAAAHVEEHHGHVAQYLGDGILAYFGWPHVHEDAARHAVAAGLRIVTDMAGIAESYSGLAVKLSVRVGLHTGLVVVGEVGGGSRTETLALGKTPNVAARLQGLADRNTVVMSDTTHELVKGFFEFESLGLHELKGVSRPMEVQQAVRETGAVERIGDSADADLLPLAGRSRELASLERAFQASRGGEVRTVLIWGEAGVGKTRLLAAFRASAESAGAAWLHCYCSPDYEHSALKPIYHLLRRVFGIGRDDTEQSALESLRAGLAEWEPCPDDWFPLFASLLGLPHSDDNLPPAPQQRKERTLEAVLELLHRIAEWKPLVLSVENIHWVDPSTRELLGRLVASAAEAKLLMLASFRPSLPPPWRQARRVDHLPLEALDEAAVHEMIESITEGASLPPVVTREILERTDGVPLFVEELTRMLVRSEFLRREGDRYVHSGELQAQAIPNTLQDLLLVRLENLGPSLDLARRCAVLGRRFSHELVTALSDLEESALQDRLSHLVAERVLLRDGLPPRAQYTFRHALLHDAAYESLLKRQRRTLHSAAADALKERFPEIAESAPEILAQHLEQSERHAEAVDCRAAAGHAAAGAWAHLEAIEQYELALADLAQLDDSRERRLKELELRSTLGVAHISTKGYGAREVQAAFGRAAELCEELEDTPFPIRFGIWAVSFLRSDREALAEQVTSFQRDAEESEDADERLVASACVATWAFYKGDLKLAGRQLATTRERFDARTHHRCARTHGGCGGFYGHLMTPWWLALTGQMERALENQDEVLALAESLGHPYTLSMALSYACAVAHEARAPERARPLAEALAILSAEHGFAMTAATADVSLGWATAAEGDAAEGVERIEHGLELYRATGALTLVPYYSSYMVEALLAAGRATPAREMAEQAAELSATNLDSFHRPEQLRLIGDALAGEGAARERVEARYREALDCARADGLALYEMRAAVSLARSLRGSSQAEEARSLLRRAVDDFESHASFADLDEARAILSEIGDVAT